MHTRLLCTALAALCTTPLAHALRWDANGSSGTETDNGQTDGSGQWLGTDRWWAAGNTTWSSGSSAYFGNGGFGGTVSLANPTNVSLISFDDFNGTYTLSGATISLSNGISNTDDNGSATVGTPLVLYSGTPNFFNSSTGLLTIGACTGTAASGNIQIIDVVGSSDSGGITLNGSISDGGGGGTVALGIANTGPGATTLSGASTFTGGVTLASGMLSINSAGVLNSSGPLGNGGTLTINGGALSGNAAVKNLNPITITKDFAFDSGTLTLPGTVDLGGLSRTITTNGGSLTFSGIVSNGENIIKDGIGTLSLSNPANSYTGDTIINAGTLSVSADGSLGNAAGDVIFNGASTLYATNHVIFNSSRTFTLNPGAVARISRGAGTITIEGKVTGAGDFVSDASWGVITLANPNNDFTGTITAVGYNPASSDLSMASISDVAGVGRINLGEESTRAGGFRWIGASGSTKTLHNRQFALAGTTGGGLIDAMGSTPADNLVIKKDLLIIGVGNKTLTLGGDNLGANAFEGNITDGTGSVISLIKNGASQWTLSGDNSFSGGLTVYGVSGGSPLNINSPTALGTGTFTIKKSDYIKLDNTSSSPITLANNNPITWEGGYLTFIGSNDLNLGMGAVIGTGHGDFTVTPRLTVLAGTLTVGGSISGVSGTGFGLTKAGEGSLVLGGVNTYTGTTTVNGGTLKLGVDDALSDSSNVVIGSGTLNLLTAVNDTVGTLDVTNAASQINLGAGATIAFANSSAVSWTGGALNITGSFVPGSSIRFGTTSGGLTSVQLALIRVNGSGAGTYTLTADGYLTGNLTAYETWSGSAVFDADSNADGVDNGLAWLLGAENKETNAKALLPVPLENAGKLVLTFDCLGTTARGSALLELQFSNDMGLSDPWTSHTAAVPGEVGISTVNGVNFTATANGALIHVMAEIPLAGASGGKLFGRLHAVP